MKFNQRRAAQPGFGSSHLPNRSRRIGKQILIIAAEIVWRVPECVTNFLQQIR